MKKLFAFIITAAIMATMAAPTFAQRRRRVESQSCDFTGPTARGHIAAIARTTIIAPTYDNRSLLRLQQPEPKRLEQTPRQTDRGGRNGRRRRDWRNDRRQEGRAHRSAAGRGRFGAVHVQDS